MFGKVNEKSNKYSYMLNKQYKKMYKKACRLFCRLTKLRAAWYNYADKNYGGTDK